jgi:peroxiredoxin
MPQTVQALTIGAKAPAFDLRATDGQRYSLGSFAGKKLLVIIFSANHCPYVAAWEDRMIAIGREYADRGVAFAAISSSDAEQFPQDSFEEMRKRAEEKGYPFPFLYDEDQSAARSYGATRTPEVFLFDEDRTLRYHGAIDSDFEEGAGMENYLRDALHLLLIGREPMVDETPPLGCVIKLRA